MLVAGGALLALLLTPARWPEPVDAAERPVWHRFRITVAAIALGALGSGLLDLADAAAELGAAVFRVSCLVALAGWFVALIRWNQARTQHTDRGISLNGVSSVLVLTSLLELAFARTRDVHAWPVQLDLFAMAGVFVVLGAAASVPGISGMVRDRRIWLQVGALAVLQAGAFAPQAVDHVL